VRLLIGASAPAATTTGPPAAEAGNDTLRRARSLFCEMQEYAAGNFARYGELLQQLGEVLLPQQ
jgi:hypothetical protein